MTQLIRAPNDGTADDHETWAITVLVLWRCAAIETRLQYDAMHLPNSEKRKQQIGRLFAFTGENTQENRLQRACMG